MLYFQKKSLNNSEFPIYCVVEFQIYCSLLHIFRVQLTSIFYYLVVHSWKDSLTQFFHTFYYKFLLIFLPSQFHFKDFHCGPSRTLKKKTREKLLKSFVVHFCVPYRSLNFQFPLVLLGFT